MEIKQLAVGSKGVFYVEINDEHLAEMGYSMQSSSTMIIEHTEVDKKLEGKGVGKQLVARAVDYAREHNIQIVLYCPFAKSVFKKIPEYQDVLFKN